MTIGNTTRKSSIKKKSNINNDPADDFSISMTDMIFEDKEYDNNNKSGTGSKKEDDDDFNTFSSSALPLDKNKGGDNGNTKNEIMKKKGTKDNDNSTDGNMNNAKNVKEGEEDTQNMIFTATSSPIRNKNGKGNIKVNDNNDNDKDNASGDIKTKRYVTPQDFELLKVIGMGAFGKVLQVKNKHSQEILAMKVISKRLLKRKTTYIENIHAEREILTKAKHPFIVNMHCSFQTKEKLFIIMDFLAGGELFLRLGRQGIFLEKTAAFYIGEIVLALEHLHSRGILHRDLKPENILLSTDGHLCLTDFGLAKDFQWDDNGTDINEDGKALTVCGTQEYMAPEMVARKGYGKAADWWSLGCIAYEMMTGNPPFESRKGAKDLFRKIMNERVRMPDGASAAACVLLKGLLNRNATARFGAAKGTMFQVGGVTQVKQLAFFAKIDWGLLEQKKVEPPERLEIDNDLDVRHFYDEFTNMGLPRSVIEMSHEHFKPRRCQSGAFRGFSFIQDDFVLPDRDDAHADNYWNNVDEDGESCSDCASSVGGDDDNATNQKNQRGGNMITSLDSTPEIPAKKKRPPRKKKKKKQQQANDSQQDTKSKNEQSKDDSKSGQTAQTNKADVVSASTNTNIQEKEKEVIQDSKTDEQVKKTGLPLSKTAQVWTPLAVGGSKISLSQKTTTTKAPETKVKSATWEAVKNPKNISAPKWETVTTGTIKQAAPLYKTSPANPLAHRKTPGTQWVSKIPRSAPPQQPIKSNSGRSLGVSGASDWRDHTLTRNVSNTGSSRSIGAPSTSNSGHWPSLGESPKPENSGTWPSLGGSSEKSKKSSAPQAVGSKAPQGPWMTKGATVRSTNVWGKATK